MCPDPYVAPLHDVRREERMSQRRENVTNFGVNLQKIKYRLQTTLQITRINDYLSIIFIILTHTPSHRVRWLTTCRTTVRQHFTRHYQTFIYTRNFFLNAKTMEIVYAADVKHAGSVMNLAALMTAHATTRDRACANIRQYFLNPWMTKRKIFYYYSVSLELYHAI